jgi:hypothetical protein
MKLFTISLTLLMYISVPLQAIEHFPCSVEELLRQTDVLYFNEEDQQRTVTHFQEQARMQGNEKEALQHAKEYLEQRIAESLTVKNQKRSYSQLREAFLHIGASVACLAILYKLRSLWLTHSEAQFDAVLQQLETSFKVTVTDTRTSYVSDDYPPRATVKALNNTRLNLHMHIPKETSDADRTTAKALGRQLLAIHSKKGAFSNCILLPGCLLASILGFEALGNMYKDIQYARNEAVHLDKSIERYSVFKTKIDRALAELENRK